MEAIIVLVAIILIVLFVLPIIAIAQANNAKQRVEKLEAEVVRLQCKLQSSERKNSTSPLANAEQKPAQETRSPLAKESPETVWKHEAAPAKDAEPESVPYLPRPNPLVSRSSEPSDVKANHSPKTGSVNPPSLTPSTTHTKSAETHSEEKSHAEKPASNFNWELFMGAKLFAWLGGLALFLGVVFFVKYAFEHSLISEHLRVTMGFIVGGALLVSGLKIRRDSYAIMTQTFCATGILILYAVTFASHTFYHFPAFTDTLTFSLMAIITAVACLIAVRMNAVAVAILGMLGGFLTPVLLSTGEDHPLVLFVYIALLDIGLIAAAIKHQWAYLAVLAAIGTMAMQFGWIGKFFLLSHYADGNRLLIPFAVMLGFQFLFLIGTLFTRDENQRIQFGIGALLSATVAWISVGYFLSFGTISARPGWVFSYMTLVDLGVIVLAISERRIAIVQAISGILAFGTLAYWTTDSLTAKSLVVMLLFYLLFALLHTALPLLLKRKRTENAATWLAVFPLLSLLLILIPVLKLAAFSLTVLPLILFVDLLAFVVAVATRSVWSIILILLLTLTLLGVWIFKLPNALDGLPLTLGAIAFFTLVFVGAAIWAAQKLASLDSLTANAGEKSESAKLAEELPMLSALTPFGLLILAMAKLPLVNPSPLFGLALFLVLLLLGIAAWKRSNWLPFVSLTAIVLLEATWHFRGFFSVAPYFHFFQIHGSVAQTLIWSALFYAVFTAYPFLFRRRLEAVPGAWMTSSLAGVAQFYWVYETLKSLWPNELHGLIPALFIVVPAVAL